MGKNPSQTITSQIFKLSVPVILSQISLTMVQLVDTMFVGKLGPIPLGAIGAVGVLLWSMLNVGEGFAIGITACIARMIGSGKPKEASRFLRSGLIGMVLFGIILTPLLILLVRPLFHIMRIPEELFKDGSVYFLWFLLFLPMIYFLTAMQASFRASGDTRTPMYVGFLINGVNVFLDWALIFGKAGFTPLGIKGAAIASGVSYSIGGFILFFISTRKYWGPLGGGVLFSVSHFFRILRVAGPSSIERAAMSASQVLVMVAAVNPLGSISIASFQIVMRLASLSFMPGFGFAISASTLSGQMLGAGKPSLAAKFIWISVLHCSIVMAGISSLYFSIPNHLIGLFTDNALIISLSKTPLRIYALLAIFLAPNLVLGGGLRGAGDTKYPMIFMFISRFSIRLPLSWFLSIYLHLGLNGVWIAMCSDFIFRAILLAIRMLGGKWKSFNI